MRSLLRLPLYVAACLAVLWVVFLPVPYFFAVALCAGAWEFASPLKKVFRTPKSALRIHASDER